VIFPPKLARSMCSFVVTAIGPVGPWERHPPAVTA
jgi:hypothetical protein